jgi:hypothetical protein
MQVSIVIQMRKTVNGGIYLPISFIKQFDIARGDISRSRFVLRALERYMKDKEIRNATN